MTGTVSVNYKVIILGDTNVGKTSILLRLRDGPKASEAIDFLTPTIGLDLQDHRVRLECGITVDLQIWDTAGQERFQLITRQYYRGAHGVILVYDISNRQSYFNILRWFRTVNDCHGFSIDSKTSLKTSNTPVFVLLGNKADLAENKEPNITVSREEGFNLHHRCGTSSFFEVSARTGQNISEAFRRLAFCLVDNWHYPLLADTNSKKPKAGKDRKLLPNKQLEDFEQSIVLPAYRLSNDSSKTPCFTASLSKSEDSCSIF